MEAWKPTLATLFLLLLLGAPLFGTLINVVKTIGTELGVAVNISSQAEPIPPKNITNLNEYQDYNKTRGLIVETAQYLVRLLTNPTTIAVLVATGILIYVYETHIRPTISTTT